ncbi:MULTISPECIES: ankyrin repeat domain-containing protein [Pseudomonas]|uniref:Antitoxin component YwqK of YwqJK toxin-antitoxin module n=1 Tax=Pseudomonas hunanensis TaxID=1247546 RepID=A0ACC6KAH3_9PSED|nr:MULTISPECIES: ankyrin repeat domain-containing protein [Pseudomonas]MBP2263762.1 antitoxin component YwqK of YwqJK toxin-antitoxin module [Pseudomonas sp. BP8]MDR6715416.1 antitoxin component YwqK of YwqJK toxin-antitoxin module [Pseudomonas hunanensis]HDS1736784.1 hypothetical protein [Pseudomonas putida]
MHKLLLPGAIALALTGCGGYDADDLKTNSGSFTPSSQYVERDSGKPASGAVTRTEDGVKTLEFSVDDGRVDGNWIARDKQGNVTEDLNLSAGQFTGTSTIFCKQDEAKGKPSVTVVVKGGQSTETQYDCASGFSLRQTVKVDAPGTPNHRRTTGEQKAWQVVDGKQVLRGVEHYAEDGSGKRDGLSEVYFASGQIGQRSHYKAGELDGRQEEYAQFNDGTSRLVQMNTYAAGKRDGDQARYFPAPWPEQTVKEAQVYANGDEVRLTSFTFGKVHVYDRQAPSDNWTLIKQIKGQDGRLGNQVTDVEGLEYLLVNSKVDLNATLDNQGNAPIHYAADNAYELLIKLGADASKLALNGQNRLQRCLTNEIGCSTEHVLKLAAEPSAKHADLYGSTPLHLLCRSGKYMSFRANGSADEQLLALVANQDVNAKDYEGKTALHYCMKKNPQFIDGLVAAGADLDAADSAGITPMQALFLRNSELEQISSMGYQVSWSPALVEQAGRLMAHSKFRFDAPFPGFEKGLKQVMIENGDAQSAMAADRLTPTAG